MRTVKRQTLPLNPGKYKELKELIVAYASEKRHWVDYLRNWDYQAKLGQCYNVRNELIKNNYQSIYHLQARHWKLALQEAFDMWDRYWESVFVDVRPQIAKRFKEENERHYAYLLLCRYDLFAEMMQGNVPESTIELTKEQRKVVASKVQKLVNHYKGANPSVRLMRSAVFDANCYKLFEQNGRQYVKVMSLKPGKRITIPLKGFSPIQGNIRVVLLHDRIEVHTTTELCAQSTPVTEIFEAVDFGYTEVMTDTKNTRYGKDLGKILTTASDNLKVKMQNRHRLHSLQRKNLVKNPAKARRIKKFNLGYKKLNKTKEKKHASIECEINRGINELVESRKMTVLITEDLSHTFKFNHPKTVNRRLSSWTRGKIQDRVEFKALAEGFRHEQVNPAYGSQICPNCDFVDKENRKGDVFKCLHCKYEDHSDRVAALNYKRRYDDPEINRYTPHREVKLIYLKRFHCRLEAEQSATVPGRTLDTVQCASPQHIAENLIKAGREKSHLHRTVNQRAKQNEHV